MNRTEHPRGESPSEEHASGESGAEDAGSHEAPSSATPASGASGGDPHLPASAILEDLSGLLGTLGSRIALARAAASRGEVPSAALRRIEEDTEEIRIMLAEIQEHSGVGPTRPSPPFPLAATVERTLERWVPAGPGIPVAFTNRLPPGARVAGPQSFLTRALQNLLRLLAREGGSGIRVELRPGGSGVEILVERDGSPLREPGTVPGLVVARWGAARLGGQLIGPSASTRGGGAASFLLQLPSVSTARPAHGETRRSWGGAAPGPLAGLRITVVDDEPTLRSVLARLLERSGAEVATLAPELGDPPAALARRIQEEGADLLLLDLNLGRFTARELLPYLQGREDCPRILLLTGDPTQAEALSLPVLPKPVDWKELTRRIRILMDEGPPREGGPT